LECGRGFYCSEGGESGEVVENVGGAGRHFEGKIWKVLCAFAKMYAMEDLFSLMFSQIM
jgi:hypothetical protein